ncbi:MAG: L,D-transpeptidase family protein [Rhodomicrobium sp.]
MKSKATLLNTLAAVGIASFGAFAVDGLPAANARSARRPARPVQSHAPSTPVLAIVSLSEQRISIYDSTAKILEAPVSTGTTGHETPAGIYSIVQKEEDHHSNLYDDASMPYMQRLTWTGMALHAGPLPGYAASHGCVRMPYGFAKQLYELSGLGLRVIVVRRSILPSNIAQPSLFTPRAGRPGLDGSDILPQADLQEQLRSIAAAKLAEAQVAIGREKEARSEAAKRKADAAPAAGALKAAKADLAVAEADLEAAERALETAVSPQQRYEATAAKSQSAARVETARAQLETAKVQAAPKLDAAAQAEEESKAASAAMNRAVEEAETAKQNTSPVSVFISRKTQRLYIRKGNEPVFEGPVSIRNPGRPIGTFVFTALNYTGTSGVMRWNVVSMYKNATHIVPYAAEKQRSAKERRNEPAAPADVAGAQAALDRLVVPQETMDRISELVLPRSSLIVSDEGPSGEVGKDTDFIVFMSGEPQGGIAMRDASRDDRGAQQGGSAIGRHTAGRHNRGSGDGSLRRSSRRSAGWRPRGRDGGFPFFFFGN